MDKDPTNAANEKPAVEVPQILDEIVIEELGIDGVCGVY